MLAVNLALDQEAVVLHRGIIRPCNYAQPNIRDTAEYESIEGTLAFQELSVYSFQSRSTT
jgi:hypothetical protein